MENISLDIETYSSEDLAKAGVYRYAESSDFTVLLIGYSFDDGPVTVLDLASGAAVPPVKRARRGAGPKAPAPLWQIKILRAQ